MPLKKIEKSGEISFKSTELLKQLELLELLESTESEKINKYVFWIDGYSLENKTAFIKFEIGCGVDVCEALFDAYEKIRINLLINYEINVTEMKTHELKNYDKHEKNKSGFIFYPLSDELIQEFREDEEIYFMGKEDFDVFI